MGEIYKYEWIDITSRPVVKFQVLSVQDNTGMGLHLCCIALKQALNRLCVHCSYQTTVVATKRYSEMTKCNKMP